MTSNMFNSAILLFMQTIFISIVVKLYGYDEVFVLAYVLIMFSLFLTRKKLKENQLNKRSNHFLGAMFSFGVLIMNIGVYFILFISGDPAPEFNHAWYDLLFFMKIIQIYAMFQVLLYLAKFANTVVLRCQQFR